MGAHHRVSTVICTAVSIHKVSSYVHKAQPSQKVIFIDSFINMDDDIANSLTKNDNLL